MKSRKKKQLMRKHKELTLNVEVYRNSLISNLKSMYSQFCKAQKKAIDLTFMGSDGNMYLLKGYEKAVKQAENLQKDIIRLQKKLRQFEIAVASGSEFAFNSETGCIEPQEVRSN